MKCRKNLSNPNVKDCMQCEYQDLCKMESILGSAKEISNIHTESTKGIMNKILPQNERLGLYGTFLERLFFL